MRLIPKRNILIISSIILIIVLLIINSNQLSSNPVSPDTPENTNTSAPINNVANESIAETQPNEDVEFGQPLNNFENVSNEATINNIRYSAIAIFSFVFVVLVSFLGYRFVFNSYEVQDLVNTSLKLAGFEEKIGFLGRHWQINNQTVLELQLNNKVRFHLRFQSHDDQPDPRMYGFRINDQLEVFTYCEPEALQLTLQSFRRYIIDLNKND